MIPATRVQLVQISLVTFNCILAFVTEVCVLNVAGFKDLISGIAVNDHDQAADMIFTIILHILVWYRNGCGTHFGTEVVLYI